MNRRIPITVTAALAALPLISGCQALDDAVAHFGPRPNDTLQELVARADEEAAYLAGDHPDLSALRAKQSEQITREIGRLCGTDSDGAVPDSCAVTREDDEASQQTGSADSKEVLLAASDNQLTQAVKAPEESRALLVEQAIDLLARAYAEDDKAFAGLASTNAGNSAPQLPAPGADKDHMDQHFADSLTELLHWQDSAVYGLDEARAFVTGNDTDALDTLNGLYSQRAEALRQALGTKPDSGAGADAPGATLPAPSYSPGGDGTLPSDAASAKSFIADVQEQDDTQWTAAATAAAQAGDENWVAWLAHQAARGRVADGAIG